MLIQEEKIMAITAMFVPNEERMKFNKVPQQSVFLVFPHRLTENYSLSPEEFKPRQGKKSFRKEQR